MDDLWTQDRLIANLDYYSCLLSKINSEAMALTPVMPSLSTPVTTAVVSVTLSNQRQAKYTENKLKAIKARNEYLLALEATNSCVFKYYIHDLSDIIDVSINSWLYSTK